jgi:YHS domain-containing protein
MISIRKFCWAALAASAIAGCSNEASNPETNPANPPITPGPAPTTTAGPSGGMSAEMKPEGTAAPKAESPAPAEAPKVEAPAKPEEPKDKADEKKADAATLSDEEVAEIKKLPPADAAVALKQMVCPVSGENLGSMEVPIKVSAEGKTFFLCCASCNKAVKADPKAVVAKLKP